jgi:hypothetical protein
MLIAAVLNAQQRARPGLRARENRHRDRREIERVGDCRQVGAGDDALNGR